LIGYGFSWISLVFLFVLKLVFDGRIFHTMIEPKPKQYYYIYSHDYKGVNQFIKNDKGMYLFKFNMDGNQLGDILQAVSQRDIIREATREELKEKLIDEL